LREERGESKRWCLLAIYVPTADRDLDDQTATGAGRSARIEAVAANACKPTTTTTRSIYFFFLIVQKY
jgi:hypothetical protein